MDWIIRAYSRTGRNLLVSLVIFASPAPVSGSSTAETTITNNLEKDVWAAEDYRLAELERRAVRLVQENPHSALGHYLLSHIYVRMFTLNPTELLFLKQASELGQQAIDLAPTADFGYIALAEVMDLMDSPQKGIGLLNQAMTLSMEPTWRTYFMLAKLYADSQDSAKILALLDQALHFKESQPDIIVPYIVAMLQAANQGDDLIAKLTDWNKRFPNVLFRQTVAMTHAEQKQFELAHTIYQQIQKSNPEFKEAFINDAVILYTNMNQPKAAAPMLHQVITVHGKHMAKDILAMVYAHHGAASLKLKDFAAAEDSFGKAASTAKGKDTVIEFLSKTYRESKHATELAKLLRKLNEEIPGQGLLHALLGETLSEDLADHEKAVAAFSNAIILEPERSDYYNGMGLVFYRMKKMNEALKLFGTAAKVDPSDATARYNEACVLARLGKRTEALSSLQEALALDPRLQDTARADSDFESMRNSSEFNLLVKSPAKQRQQESDDILGH